MSDSVPTPAPKGPSGRQNLSAAEVEAQRKEKDQKKKAEKAARVAAAAAKAAAKAAGKDGETTSTSTSTSAATKPAKPPKHQKASSTSTSTSTPSHSHSHSPSLTSVPTSTISPATSAPSSTRDVTPLNIDENTGDSGRSKKQTTAKSGHHPVPVHAPLLQHDDPKQQRKFEKTRVVQRTLVQKQVPLFSHLPQYERETSLSLKVGFSSEEIHPAIIRLGLQFAAGTIAGANARCIAMLTAFNAWIQDYQTPADAVISRDLQQKLKPCIRFLIDCRPQSISMGNAIRYLKMKIASLPADISEIRAKQQLQSDIMAFIQERITFADEVIANYGASKIQDGDVILTYATSHVVEMILKKAHADGRRFRLIIVDARPKLEGKQLLQRLVAEGIKCSYCLINTISYVIKTATKVYIGASAMLANGTVIGRVGSAVVGMMCHTYKIPLLVCCETYKFHERVQLDSICFNELGDPDDLIATDRDDTRYGDVLTDWRDISRLKLLNLTYDLTPVEFVNMVITEVGMIPPTSVPVIIREYHKDNTGDGQDAH